MIKRKRFERILLSDIDKTFLIHNGKKYITIKTTFKMVDHKFGEFVLTRAITNRKKDEKKSGKNVK